MSNASGRLSPTTMTNLTLICSVCYSSLMAPRLGTQPFLRQLTDICEGPWHLHPWAQCPDAVKESSWMTDEQYEYQSEMTDEHQFLHSYLLGILL